jgi:threonine-phosphate decarboxylase
MNIYRAAELLKVPVRRIIDFSVPVNPLGTSKKVKAELRKHLKDLKNYPDIDCSRMKKHLSRFHGIKPENIVEGGGITELINLILFTLKPQKILLPVPAYSEHEEAFNVYQQSSSDTSVEYLSSSENNNFKLDRSEFADKLKKCDVAILCNPGYPVGNVLRKAEVLEIAKEAGKSDCLLIVDESYIDYVPDETVIDSVLTNPGMIVLRSMTCFHALAGLRIGYCVMNENIAGKISAFSLRWPVNSMAQRAAVIAIKDKTFRKESHTLMKEEKTYLEKELGKIGIKYYPSSVNYYLLKVPSSEDLYEYLLRKYILVKKCDDIKGLGQDYICISVNDHRENTVLIKALREYYKQRD